MPDPDVPAAVDLTGAPEQCPRCRLCLNCTLDDCTGCTPAAAKTPSVLEMSAHMAGSQQCSMGNHVWTPWLVLPNGSYVTRCTRAWCSHEVRFDA